MSLITYHYPEPVERRLALHSPWQVREDEDDYYPVYSIDDPTPQTPLELLERISRRLQRTVRIAALLKNAEYPSRDTVNETLFVITGLIEETVEDADNLHAKLLDQGPPRYG